MRERGEREGRERGGREGGERGEMRERERERERDGNSQSLLLGEILNLESFFYLTLYWQIYYLTLASLFQ